MATVTLRAVADADLDFFFEHQLDAGARALITWPGEEAMDRRSFDAKWDKTRADATNFTRTIVVEGGAIAGYICSFHRFELREVGYWVGREHWGRGIATEALRQYLATVETHRPLHARVSKHNHGSLRVVQKCGFVIYRDDKWTPPGEGAPEIAEWVLRLE